jgi:RimJ/RimL family protein N-acetyltransferase
MDKIYLDICKPIYWDSIGKLRATSEISQFFIEEYNFNSKLQVQYMEKNSKYFHVVLVNGKFAGYIGLIGPNRNEITYCVDPEYQNKGLGTYMITQIMQLSPKIWAKVKHNNPHSIYIFKKLGFTPTQSSNFTYFNQ